MEAVEETPTAFPPKDSFPPFTHLQACEAMGGAFHTERSSTEYSGGSIRGDGHLTERDS